MLQVEEITAAGVHSRAVRVEGDESAPAFLFLHGFSDSADGWRRVQRRLGKLGYRSLAVDQPSHGHADALRDDRPVIGQFVEFAAAAARLVADGEPVVVVGNSLGGAHALLLAQHHPELVRGVVAISPAGFDHPRYFEALNDDGPMARRMRRPGADGGPSVPRSPNRIERAVADTGLRLFGNAGMRAMAFGRPWRAPRGFIDDWRQQWNMPDRRRALRSLVMRVRDEYLDVDPFDLSALDMPVMALWGTLDRLVLVSSRRALEAGVADLDFVEFPGIGHMPQIEAPGRTTKHLDRFARRMADVPVSTAG